MSVRSGFFNSLNGDRKYYTTDISALFDGIINDGVFASVGTAFGVTADTGLNVLVGVGRAWFNSTWLLNDSVLPITLDQSELLLNRYDAIVIEIDHSEGVRKGDIKVIKGVPASSPAYPTLTNNGLVHQYPIAYIYRKSEGVTISQSDITYVVGQGTCPFVTGILDVMPIDTIIAQWRQQWAEYLESVDVEHDTMVDDTARLMAATLREYTEWFSNHKDTASDEYNKWYGTTTSEFEAWLEQQKNDFVAWYAELQVALDGDVAANHSLRIIELEHRFDDLHKEHAVYDILTDSNGNPIEDELGLDISARVAFALAGENETALDEIPIGVTEHRMFNITIGTEWNGDAAPYHQDIVVPGIKETDIAHMDIIHSMNVDTVEKEAEAYGLIFKFFTYNDGILVYAMNKTEISLNAQLEVIR